MAVVTLKPFQVKRITVNMSLESHTRLKIFAAKHHKTINDVMIEAASQYMEKVSDGENAFGPDHSVE